MSTLEHAGRPIEILLIEDNPGDVRLTQEALFEIKIRNRLSVASDGVDGLAFLRREDGYANAPRPDLILLDLNMPRKNGREVLAEIKEDPDLRRIPVIMLTTSDAERDILAAYDLQVNAYVTKPIDMAQFIDIVHELANFWFTIVQIPEQP